MSATSNATSNRFVGPIEPPFTLPKVVSLLQPLAPQDETDRVLGASKDFAERCVPGAIPVIELSDHVHRYLLAMSYVKDMRTLDIACGSGYGTAMLCAAGAKSVTGIDISGDAVDYAMSRYQAPDLKYMLGDAQAIPLPDGSMDTVVSYETIEHVPDWRVFLKEVRRVLRPGGTFLVSTPNITVTSYGQHPPYNPHHLKEFTPEEFVRVLEGPFKSVELFSQLLANRFKVKCRYLAAKALAGFPSLKTKLRNAVLAELPGSKEVNLETMHNFEAIHKLSPYQSGRIQIPTFVVALCR
jgi:2-polyprenyl-3-methyl-5-hydroxy-6-metoxy-1,4-benzoquinol methylase